MQRFVRPGVGIGEVRLPTRVAADAEVGALHGAEAEAMLVVVARRAQAAAELARGDVADEALAPSAVAAVKPSRRSAARAARSSSSAR